MINLTNVARLIVYLWVLIMIGFVIGPSQPISLLKNFFSVVGGIAVTAYTSLAHIIKEHQKNKRRNQPMAIERINAKSAGIVADNVNSRNTDNPDQPDIDLAALEAGNHGIPYFDHQAPVRLRGIVQRDPNEQSTAPKVPDEMDKLAAHVHRATPLNLDPNPKEEPEVLEPPKNFIDIRKKRDNEPKNEDKDLLDSETGVDDAEQDPKPSKNDEEPKAISLKIDDKPAYDLTPDDPVVEESTDILKEEPSDDRQQLIRSLIHDFRFAYSEVGALSILEALWLLDRETCENLIKIFLECTDKDDLSWIYNILDHSKKIDIPDSRMRQVYRISKDTGVDVDTVITVLRQVNMM